MANYTLTLQQILTNHKIFDFEYPMFNDDYKPTFEKLFIDYFLTEEIAHETIGLFKHRLQTKLNLIMPYYNKLYMSQELEQRILDNYDVTEVINRVVTGDGLREMKGDNNRTTTGNVVTSSNTSDKQLYKDAPKTKIDVDKFDVVTNLTKNEGETTVDNKTSDEENISNNVTETNETNNVENFTRTMTGNIGVQTDSDSIVKYWQSLRNVTFEIFENELIELFMGVF